MKKIILYSLIIITVSSCSFIYGIHYQKNLDYNEIEEFIVRNDLSEYQNLFIKENYYECINKLDLPGEEKRYLLQPLQVFYFDSSKQLLSYHVNCNAGGFPNLKWDREKHFDQFPPVSQTKLSKNITADLILGLSNSLSSVDLTIDEGNFYVIVYWNLFLERQSKRLIDIVLKNIETHKMENRTKVFLINNDFLFLTDKN